ncbi:MAG: hypothetical protein K9M57_10710 [Phycisphaerae bacterium]|nr:hypothetical protein [Phycisphaerae bacterium]
MIWIISGACRHVGKTWLAEQLASRLPNAIAVKIGHNTPDRNKKNNYFTNLVDFDQFLTRTNHRDHHIIESNTLALQNKGEVQIFIAANRHATNIRKDADSLKAAAHIVIAQDADEQQWYQFLTTLLPSRQARDVCKLLNEHKQYILKNDQSHG